MGSYVPSTQAQREQMLRAVGLENIMDLYRDVPEQMLLRKPLNIPDGMSELEASRAVSAMAAENRTYATVLRGAGPMTTTSPPSSNISPPRRSSSRPTPPIRRK